LLLTGKPKISLPLKKKEEVPKPQAPSPAPATPAISGPVTSRCTVVENGKARTFIVTVEPEVAAGADQAPAPSAVSTTQQGSEGTPVFSKFPGAVEVVNIMVRVGDRVSKGQAVAMVEAMKANHEIKAPCDGTVTKINVNVGDEVDSSVPIMIIA